jgi:hypothetical protein
MRTLTVPARMLEAEASNTTRQAGLLAYGS